MGNYTSLFLSFNFSLLIFNVQFGICSFTYYFTFNLYLNLFYDLFLNHFFVIVLENKIKKHLWNKIFSPWTKNSHCREKNSYGKEIIIRKVRKKESLQFLLIGNHIFFRKKKWTYSVWHKFNNDSVFRKKIEHEYKWYSIGKSLLTWVMHHVNVLYVHINSHCMQVVTYDCQE